MNDKQLFPKFQKAVEALSECCRTEDGKEIPPIARSEVYNETWMLRLTLALLHDSERDFSKIKDEKKQKALELLWDALQRNWISEGGLKPAFDKEGTTWVDAILGDVTLEEDKSKRGVKVDLSPADSHVVVVVEAKMGSALDSDITNSSNYDQAARNIACLAKLVENWEALSKKSAFLVFAPKQKLDEWERKKKSVKTLIDNAWEVIAAQGRTHQWKDDDNFKNAVKYVRDNSTGISWEEVIKSVNCKEGIVDLCKFYNETCTEYGIKSQL